MKKILMTALAFIPISCSHMNEKTSETVQSDPEVESMVRSRFIDGCIDGGGADRFCRCAVDSVLTDFTVEEVLVWSVTDKKKFKKEFVRCMIKGKCYRYSSLAKPRDAKT